MLEQHAQVLTAQSRCLGEVGICSGEQQGELLGEPKVNCDDPGKHRPKRETDARHLLAFSAFQSPNEPPLVYLYRGRMRKADARLGMPDLDNKND